MSFFFFHSLLRQRSIKVDKIFRPNICIIWIMRLLFVAPACIRMSRGTKLQIFGYNIGNWIFSKHFWTSCCTDNLRLLFRVFFFCRLCMMFWFLLNYSKALIGWDQTNINSFIVKRNLIVRNSGQTLDIKNANK